MNYRILLLLNFLVIMIISQSNDLSTGCRYNTDYHLKHNLVSQSNVGCLGKRLGPGILGTRLESTVTRPSSTALLVCFHMFQNSDPIKLHLAA